MGLEPTTSSSTDWRSNHLSYTHHVEGLRGVRAGEKYAQTGVFCQGTGEERKAGLIIQIDRNMGIGDVRRIPLAPKKIQPKVVKDIVFLHPNAVN